MPSRDPREWLPVLTRAVEIYTGIFRRVGAAHDAVNAREYPQHREIWPLMGLGPEGNPGEYILEGGNYQGMCAGLSNLWIYYQNFFQDGIYKDNPVHLYDVFSAASILASRVTRLEVTSKEGAGKLKVVPAETQSGAAIGLKLKPVDASPRETVAFASGPPGTNDDTFRNLRAMASQYSLLADVLNEVHKFGNEGSAKKQKEDTVKLLARFACEPANRSKEFSRPWSGLGSFMKVKRFYTLASGSHAMALSTYHDGVLFYDPNVGELRLPLTKANGFFRDYFTETFTATHALKTEHAPVTGAPEALSKKKLTLVEWKSTRPGR